MGKSLVSRFLTHGVVLQCVVVGFEAAFWGPERHVPPLLEIAGEGNTQKGKGGYMVKAQKRLKANP